jgi:hypothetical protein
MTGHDADLDFPSCCAHCPFRDDDSASCAHDFRQALVWELDTGRTCSVYRQQKTDAMRQLAATQ